jgi:hypothetical protein
MKSIKTSFFQHLGHLQSFLDITTSFHIFFARQSSGMGIKERKMAISHHFQTVTHQPLPGTMLEYVGLCWIIFGCGGYNFSREFDLSTTPFVRQEKFDAGFSGWARLNVSATNRYFWLVFLRNDPS